MIEKLQGKQVYVTKLILECVEDQLDLTLTVNLDNTELQIRFKNVSGITIKEISFPMCVQGFEIIDNQKKNGWEGSQRYTVHDFEDETIHFYCQRVVCSIP